LRRTRIYEVLNLGAWTGAYAPVHAATTVDPSTAVYELAAEFEVIGDRISRILQAPNIDRRYHQTVHVDLDRAAVLRQQASTLSRLPTSWASVVQR